MRRNFRSLLPKVYNGGINKNTYKTESRYHLMPRTKGSKNRAKLDFDAQIAKLQKDKALLEDGVAKTVAQIEELKCGLLKKDISYEIYLVHMPIANIFVELLKQQSWVTFIITIVITIILAFALYCLNNTVIQKMENN